jgi:ankyrin repeat protein
MPNGSDQIPLDVASVFGNREVTRFLAEHMSVTDPLAGIDVTPSGEDIQVVDPDATMSSFGSVDDTGHLASLVKTSLHDASAAGNVGIVQTLLDEGADVNERKMIYQNTALNVASMNGKLEIAKLLIEYGADVNCQNKFGWTSLHSATRFGHHNIVTMLLDHGADVDARKEDLLTPLHLASLNDRVEIARLLLERGADVHLQDIHGRTPFGVAPNDRDLLRLLSRCESSRGLKRKL